MKTSHVFILVAAALGMGFLAARWCAAAPLDQPPAKDSIGDFGAMEQSTSFENYLRQTKQTDILERYIDLSNANLALHENAGLGRTLAILQSLRDGHTNQAIELLEGDLDTHIIMFDMSYRHVPLPFRDQPGLKYLRQARDYRARYPLKHQSPSVDDAVADAFKVLDEKK